jgi:hypothetical protein
MSPQPEMPFERHSTAPLSMDFTGSVPLGWARRVPRSWVGMSGYLAAGVLLGLILILALSLTRSSDAAAASLPPGAITDNIVRLGAEDIGDSCWQGATKADLARITVSLEVGVDGKVRYAAAAGESPTMRGCVEAHVRSWEFLPQSEATTMVLPFEIARR